MLPADVVDQRLKQALSDLADLNEVADQRLKQAWSNFRFPRIGSRLKMLRVFPFLSDLFHKKDRMLLQKCISLLGPNLDIEHVLKSEAVAVCVFLLFLRVPPPIMEASAFALASISPGFRGIIPDVSNQEEVEHFVLEILRDGSGEESVVEVQRQVCLSISYLASCSNNPFLELVCDPFVDDMYYRHLELQFGPGINCRLLQLIRNPSCSSKLTSPLLSAIANIALVSQDMTEKIFKAEVSECWLGKLMDKEHDHSFLQAACFAVACIASYACRVDNTELWNYFKSLYVPFILNKCLCIEYDCGLTRAAALALLWITRCAKSARQIDELVDGGCLKAFFRMNTVCFNNDVLNSSVEAISIILKSGSDGNCKRKRRQGPKYNKYVKLVDAFDYGWDALDADKHWEYYNFNVKCKALEILLEYCPRVYYDETWKPIEEYDLESSSSDDESDDEEKNKMSED